MNYSALTATAIAGLFAIGCTSTINQTSSDVPDLYKDYPEPPDTSGLEAGLACIDQWESGRNNLAPVNQCAATLAEEVLNDRKERLQKDLETQGECSPADCKRRIVTVPPITAQENLEFIRLCREKREEREAELAAEYEACKASN